MFANNNLLKYTVSIHIFRFCSGFSNTWSLIAQSCCLNVFLQYYDTFNKRKYKRKRNIQTIFIIKNTVKKYA